MTFWKVVLTAVGVFFVITGIAELIMWPIRKARLNEFTRSVKDAGEFWDERLRERIGTNRGGDVGAYETGRAV